MAAYFGKQSGPLACGIELATKHRRGEIADDGRPGTVYPLTTVEGVFASHALAPSLHALTMDGDQNDTTPVSTAKARLKEIDERHLDLAQSYSFNSHLVQT